MQRYEYFFDLENYFIDLEKYFIVLEKYFIDIFRQNLKSEKTHQNNPKPPSNFPNKISAK